MSKLIMSGRLHKTMCISIQYHPNSLTCITTCLPPTRVFVLQDDGKLDKLSSLLGFGKVDHYAEVTDKTAMINVDSPQTGRVSDRGQLTLKTGGGGGDIRVWPFQEQQYSCGPLDP